MLPLLRLVRAVVDYAAENAHLRAENLDLHKVNELLEEASAFFASELAPDAWKRSRSSTSILIVPGRMFIYKTLTEHLTGSFMTACGYRAAKKCLPSARALRDSELIMSLRAIHKDNYGVLGP
ncbi:MAG: hypothetical protein Q4A71_02655 [Actinomycetaceae bacterium]|nr:hypothetical protein [Actinomycetaceae bacterium]